MQKSVCCFHFVLTWYLFSSGSDVLVYVKFLEMSFVGTKLLSVLIIYEQVCSVIWFLQTFEPS